MFSKDFENFKSNVRHSVKNYGDIPFLEMMESSEVIEDALEFGYYKEGLYLLAMVEYLCKENNIRLPQKYKRFSNLCLSEKIYPAGVMLLAMTSDPTAKERWDKQGLATFSKYNIVEGDIRDVY